jgi:hypothetical protein
MQESEKASAEYRDQISALRARLDAASSASAAEKAELTRKIEELQNR